MKEEKEKEGGENDEKDKNESTVTKATHKSKDEGNCEIEGEM